MISCFMKTTYGAYTDSLRRALEPLLGEKVDVISSNCGCGDPHAKHRVRYGLGCRYFEFPNVSFRAWDDGQSVAYKYRGRLILGKAAYWSRAQIYASMSRDADIVHFQQVLGAFGSRSVFNWLKTNPKMTKVVTVHELDPYQLEFPALNRIYNRADQIIVLFSDMKDRLVGLGVDPDRISIIHYGTEEPEAVHRERRGIVFYGGHHFNRDKGIEGALRAFKAIVRGQEHDDLRLSIHGQYGSQPPQEIADLVSSYDLGDRVVWLNNIYEDEITRLYESSLFLLAPFKGSSAGGAATRAMACGLPVISTREAGLPDHLGELGIYVDVGDDQALEREMRRLLDDPDAREAMANPLRQRAEESFSWNKIAADTLGVYRAVLR
jgi:glycosyltransferase involved in cell wall biosynthesis